MSLLTGRTALVTGASRGIGKAIAKALSREGARVIICGRKQDALNTLAEEMGASMVPMACHVGRADDVHRLAESAGPVDILVNNAATNIQFGSCLEADEAQFDKMVETNLKSAFRLIKALAPGMVDRGWGSIINISSVAGIRPQDQSLLYSMTKAALIMMTKSYALEFGPRGVRVNAIAPGLIQTQLSEYFWKDDARQSAYIERQPLRHLGQPEEIAGLAVLLASDRGSYVTGQVFVADGGLLIS